MLQAELADPSVLALGCRDADGRLLAAARAHVDPGRPAIAEIGRLTVVPDRQGEGLGSRLLAAIEDAMPATVTELQLFTGERSKAKPAAVRPTRISRGQSSADGGWLRAHSPQQTAPTHTRERSTSGPSDEGIAPHAAGVTQLDMTVICRSMVLRMHMRCPAVRAAPDCG